MVNNVVDTDPKNYGEAMHSRNKDGCQKAIKEELKDWKRTKCGKW